MENPLHSPPDPPEIATMNKTITGTETQLKPTVTHEENVELIRKVRATMPPVRDELVNEIKAKIKAGSYDVSAETIAQDILAHLRSSD
jgi:flagellar biosynthesis anti-sigma factor FlgM